MWRHQHTAQPKYTTASSTEDTLNYGRQDQLAWSEDPPFVLERHETRSYRKIIINDESNYYEIYEIKLVFAGGSTLVYVDYLGKVDIVR